MLLDVGAQPIQTLIKTITRGSARSLDGILDGVINMGLNH